MWHFGELESFSHNYGIVTVLSFANKFLKRKKRWHLSTLYVLLNCFMQNTANALPCGRNVLSIIIKGLNIKWNTRE